MSYRNNLFLFGELGYVALPDTIGAFCLIKHIKIEVKKCMVRGQSVVTYKWINIIDMRTRILFYKK